MPSFHKKVTQQELDRILDPRRVAEQQRAAKVKAMVWALEKLLKRHFELHNGNTRYVPNTKSYEEWKRRKHPNSLYQLVLSGELRDAVMRGKVTRDGEYVFSLPNYGIYLIEGGRDFLSFDRDEDKQIDNKRLTEFFKIRKEFANG